MPIFHEIHTYRTMLCQARMLHAVTEFSADLDLQAVERTA